MVAVTEVVVEGPSADPVACLEHHDRPAGMPQRACRRQPAISDEAYREAVVSFYTGLAALQTSQEVLARQQLERVTTLAPAQPTVRQHTHPVVEIFGPTIQGEGAEAGLPTHFVRLGGCDYRCAWCDTMYAVEPRVFRETAERLSTDAIVRRLSDLGGRPEWVTISGGNPALHRLERKGWLASKWDAHREHNRECKYYRLTPAGRKQLAAAESKWERLQRAIARVMAAAARA